MSDTFDESAFAPGPGHAVDPLVAPRRYGLYRALVVDIVDPEEQGRVQVSFPSLAPAGKAVVAWAVLLSPYADANQGLQILPEVGSQVVCAFEAGDPGRPFVVGACWSAQRPPPEAAAPANDLRTLKTRSGSQLQFDDTVGAAKITLSTQSGHRIEFDDAAQSVAIAHANGSTIVIDAAGRVTITAASTVDVSAPAIDLHAAIVACDGVLECTTLIASQGVVSPSYTPGTGNLW